MCQLYGVPRSHSCESGSHILIAGLLLFIVILAVSFDGIYDHLVISSKLSDEDYATYKELKCQFHEVAKEQCGHVGDGTLTRIVSERDRILKKYGISQRTRWIAYDVYEDNSGSKLAEAF